MKIKLSKVPSLYINLERDVERNDNMVNFLSACFDSYKRVSAFDARQVYVTEKTQGLWAEHEVALRHSVAVARSHIKALDSIDQLPAIIFEDDIQIIKYKNTLNIPKDADIVYLGFVPVMMTDPTGSNFQNVSFSDLKADWAKVDKSTTGSDCYRLYGMICCHAMLYVTDRAVKRALEVFRKSEESGMPIDILSSEFMQDLNVYVTKKTLFGQRHSLDTHSHAKDFNTSGEPPGLELVM